MKIVIYGVGKEFCRFFSDKEFVQCLATQNNLEIVGIADGNTAMLGKIFSIMNKEFSVCDINNFPTDSFDQIIITTQYYFEEIKGELLQKGYQENQIAHIQELYLDVFFNTERFEGKLGVEIGGPSDLFLRIYARCASCDGVNFSSSTVWWKGTGNIFQYQDMVLGNIIIAEATEMNQIKDQAYDFLLSSNNLEHIANPLKALMEFARIVKVGGYILILVPVKTETFDHARKYTTFEHILSDYYNNVREDDMSHIDEIIENHDYDMDPLCGGRENFIRRAKKNADNRCLHHHVFNESCLRKSLEFVGLKVDNFGKMGSNFVIIGRK